MAIRVESGALTQRTAPSAKRPMQLPRYLVVHDGTASLQLVLRRRNLTDHEFSQKAGAERSG